MRLLQILVVSTIMLLTQNIKSQPCNKLGAWLWYLEITGFENFEKLADSLSQLGVKRIFVKVADGSVDSTKWPELIDESIPKIFEEKGIEAWAWSYNYPNNYINQAKALFFAARSGYKGYIVDVEMQFDGNRPALNAIFSAFHDVKQGLIDNQMIPDSFKLYCTTWGNPMDHNFYIDAIDPYVDGYMAQTYVENWGNSYMNQLEKWIEAGTEEYKSLGATKPVHHIVSTEKGIITVDQINRFIRTAGEETSVWPIPGNNTSLSLWNIWRQIDWNVDFCLPSFTYNSYIEPTFFYPNPARDMIVLNEAASEYVLTDMMGKVVQKGKGKSITEIHIALMQEGIYILTIKNKRGEKRGKVAVI
jgi:hypothetical protein